MATMKRAAIRLDEALYPRYAKSSGKIHEYIEAMNSGAVFPPLAVDQHGRLIDGLHRLEAYDARGVDDIPVERVRVASDAQFFKLALKANSTHGHRYTHIDYANMVLRGKELGISNDAIAELVSVTPGYLDDVVRDWFGISKATGRPVPLKRTIKHMRGQTLTEDQEAANKKLSGMHANFYANQVMLLCDNDLYDPDSEVTVLKLQELAESVGNYLKGVAKRKGVRS